MRLVYIHVPRTAGNSILHAIVNDERITVIQHNIRDVNYQYYENLTKEDDCVIAFVRDPHQRALSAFHYLKNGGNNTLDMLDSKKLGLDNLSFSEFVKNGLEKASKWQIHFMPQSRWLRGAGNPDIYKYERLDDEFNQMCEKYNIKAGMLQHLNFSENFKRKPYQPTHVNKDIIHSVYGEDYVNFGYYP